LLEYRLEKGSEAGFQTRLQSKFSTFIDVSCPDLKNRLPTNESELRMEIFLEMEGAGISKANEGEFSDGLII